MKIQVNSSSVIGYGLFCNHDIRPAQTIINLLLQKESANRAALETTLPVRIYWMSSRYLHQCPKQEVV